MKKRIIFRLFLLSLLIGALVVLFQFIRLPFLPVQSYEAIPNNSSVMLEFSRASEADQMLKEHGNIFMTEKISSDWDVFKNTFNWKKDSKFLTGLRLGSKQDLELIYVLERDKIFKLKEAVANLELNKLNEYSFNNHTIYKIQNANNQLIIITQFRNLLVFARNSFLVEESISQLKNYSSNFKKQRNFKRLQRTDIGEVAACLYVNFENLPKQISSYLGLKKRGDIANFGKWVNWVKLGFKPSEKGYECSGAVTGKIELASYLEPLKNDGIYKVLPDNVAVFTRMEAPLVGEFSKEFQQFFQPWFSGEIAYVHLEPFSAKNNAEKFMVARCSDSKLAEELLSNLGEKVGKLESYDYQMFHVEQLMAEDVLMPVFGKRLNPFKNPFYVVLDHFIIFCNSKGALEVWLDKYLGGQTLANSTSFLQAQIRQPDHRTICFSLNINRLSQVLQNYLQPKYRDEFVEYFKPYKDFETFSLGMHAKGKRQLLQGEIHKSSSTIYNAPIPKRRRATEVAWKAKLGSEAAIAPIIYKSRETGEYQILIQDIENILYSFSRDGVELWKRQIDGRIFSKITVIDDEKKTTQKLVFNTNEKIFVCNTLGEDIEAFPLTMSSEILNEVTAIDFNQNEEYVYLVACKNRNIYGFKEDGTPLPGWSPNKNVGKILHQIKHLQTFDKDFVMALNNKGILNVFKRDGSERFSKIKTNSSVISPPDFDADALGQRMVVSSSEGEVSVVNLEGEIFKMHMNVGENKNVEFLFENLIGDSRKDYIALSDSDLSIYYYNNSNFKKAYSLQLNASQDELFFPSKGIGTLSVNNAEINWILPAGNLHSDFPLGGTTAFQIVDLFEDKRDALVVGLDSGICVYWLGEAVVDVN